MLKQRVVTAVWGLPLLIALVWFDKPLPWFTVLVALWGILAAFEFYRLLAAAKIPVLAFFGLAWVLFFILSGNPALSAFLKSYFGLSSLTPLLLTSAVLFSLIWRLRRAQREGAFAGWAWTMGGILYLGWLLSYLVALRGLDGGRDWVFLAFFANFASDTAAFFVGRGLGRRRLAPHISPAKTWEGAIGGVFGAIGVSLLFMLPTPLHLDLGWAQSITFGLLVSVFGQLGDLVESLFKRNMGVKDSGRLVLGHGGFLDRIDSVIFAGVVAYYYAAAFNAGWLDWLACAVSTGARAVLPVEIAATMTKMLLGMA